MSYLLDTNVVSELRKSDPDPYVLAWYGQVSSDQLFLSVLTLGEIRRGIERLRRKDEPQAELLEAWLSGLLIAFRDRVAAIDARVAEEWGRLNLPNPVPVTDGLIAATANARGWTLVTRNTSAVQGAASLLNPFKPPT
ncbi:MAG: type II toxin-antitoxin system VapC family toxin [Streptosporangiaceae bacterium]